MSAFIVEDKTINHVVNYLINNKNDNISRIGYSLDKEGGAEILASDMFRLNCEAVNIRYGEDESSKFRKLDFKFNSKEIADDYQVFKSLNCWSYQCSEGHIPDTSELFKVMEEIKRDISYKIVVRLEKYKNSNWG